MLTPYDWQEGIAQRSAFVQGRLSAGTPVIMLSIPEGILAFAMRRQARKVYEIYDRLIFGAIGQQSDVEAMRVSALDFAHQEGYTRSEEDVTIQRVVAALSTPLKRAFSEVNATPFVVQGLFGEVNATPEEDQFYLLDFDGDFSIHRGGGYLMGDPDSAALLYEGLNALKGKALSPADARVELRKLWMAVMDPAGERGEAALENLTEEAILLQRHSTSESRFVDLVSSD